MMSQRPIATEEEYAAALQEMERVFDARLNTPAGDRLQILFELVESYEEQHYKIDPPDLL